jgi:hypothetical protein
VTTTGGFGGAEMDKDVRPEYSSTAAYWPYLVVVPVPEHFSESEVTGKRQPAGTRPTWQQARRSGMDTGRTLGALRWHTLENSSSLLKEEITAHRRSLRRLLRFLSQNTTVIATNVLYLLSATTFFQNTKETSTDSQPFFLQSQHRRRHQFHLLQLATESQ